MKHFRQPLRLGLGQLFTKLGLGMRAKLITLFVIIKILPLILLAYLAWHQTNSLGEDMRLHSARMASKAMDALARTGEIAVQDAVTALDARATEDIERLTTDTARHIADFLYSRDSDVLMAASLDRSPQAYAAFLSSLKGRITQPGQWELARDGKSWQKAGPPRQQQSIESSSRENDYSFHYRAPDEFEYALRPLYREITFVDLAGREEIKVVSSPDMDAELRDVSDSRNTFVRAERYFPQLKDLKPGEIYVSEVIGEYVGSRVIGVYTPESAARVGEAYAPEASAFAGKENPVGKRFRGIVRWATPVERDGEMVGYVTLALDHDHILEFTNRLSPTPARYTELPDASDGNYAFIWDFKGRSIAHPRHFSITGYDAETGSPQVPWLEEGIYRRWKESELSYEDFIRDEPVFVEQSHGKRPAKELTRQGLVGLDCRYLNFAPQCTGWFDLTRDGGSGSFLIHWSGLWKLTTAAAIPYYTGQYGQSPRGFGFVAIGAGTEDFHRPAKETEKVLEDLLAQTDRDLETVSGNALTAIAQNLIAISRSLTTSTMVMGAVVILIAIWMASTFTGHVTTLIAGISRFRRGERDFRFHTRVKDELGALADSFDEMADSVVDSKQHAEIIVDLEYRFLYANALALSQLGRTGEEIKGRLYDEFAILPYGSAFCPIAALKNGAEAEVLYQESSGRYYQGRASYLKDAAGREIGYVIVTADVTRIVDEQKKNDQHRILMATVFSASPDLIWYEDEQGRFLAANPRFASLVGMDPVDMRGKHVGSVLPENLAARFAEYNRQAATSGSALYTEESVTFMDGHLEWLDVVRTPLFDLNGDYVGMLGVARDVSQRVQAEADLRKTQLQLEEAVKSATTASEFKSAFLARISHEIRTPMNAIIGMASISRRKLKQSPIPAEELVSHVRQIELSSMYLLGLLNDVLDISKIEAGKTELLEESFDILSLANEVSVIIGQKCQEKDISFKVVTELEKRMFVSDPLRLRQVLINLLGNAVKFTSEHGEIVLALREAGQKQGYTLVSFTVADTGIGIPAECLSTLFTPFEQGGAFISKHYGGTGLGLSISKGIVTLLGGDITVESTVGKGTTFSFSLWLKEDEALEQNSGPQGECRLASGKRVLLVDDVAVNRFIVKEQLSDCGLAIDEAENGEEAVELFSQSSEGHYDVILMDVQMPRMNGYEATAVIRGMARADAAGIPIVAMTASAFREDIERALSSGMNAHLAKPLEKQKLMQVLSNYLTEG